MKYQAGFWHPDIDDPWQVNHLQAAFRYVTDFSVAIDGGANVGIWTREMSDVFSNVYAFEPAEDTYRCLVKNTEGYKPGVEAIHAALGDRTGRCGVLNDKTKVKSKRRYITGGDDTAMMTVDQLEMISLGLLKLDLEGYEGHALRGAEKTIMRFHPVIVIEEYSKRRGTHNDTAEILKGWGYERREFHAPDGIWVFP